MSADDPEARLTELEVKVAYQEATIAALDEVVREFAERTAVLERQLKELREASPGQVGPADDPPPHY